MYVRRLARHTDPYQANEIEYICSTAKITKGGKRKKCKIEGYSLGFSSQSVAYLETIKQ